MHGLLTFNLLSISVIRVYFTNITALFSVIIFHLVKSYINRTQVTPTTITTINHNIHNIKINSFSVHVLQPPSKAYSVHVTQFVRCLN